MSYSFFCPLTGCTTKMTASQPDREAATQDLVSQAEAHLMQVHPDIHKSHEEIDADIRTHMVVQG